MRIVAVAWALVCQLGIAVVASAAATEAAWGPIEIAKQKVEPGEKRKFSFFVEPSFEGAFLDTPIFTARGATPGPSLCVTSGVHGDEINSVEIARRVFARVDPKQLHGTLIVLPAINSWGLRTSSRMMPDRRDLNRFFPGNANGSVASIVANGVFRLIREHCNFLIDLHTGSDFRTNVPQIRADLSNPEIKRLALQFGVGIVIDGQGPNGSLRREAVKAGIPAIIYEAGPPLIFREDEIARGTQGVMNVLDAREMFESVADVKESDLLARSFWVRVPRGQGGFFLSTIPLGSRVREGQLLGTVVDPLTDEVHEIRSPGHGTVIGMAFPRVVLSGFGIFHIGEIASK